MQCEGALECALHKDCVQSLGAALYQAGLHVNAYFEYHDRQGCLQQRDLLSLAAQFGALSCVAALLAAGADCNAHSPSDGNTALHCACSSANISTARVIALLLRAGADKMARNHTGLTACDLLSKNTAQVPCREVISPEDGDLMRPEYSTDAFRMYQFKIDCCPRLAESHDWTLCPFQHPGEKARRRDPRTHRYQGVPCPDFRKGTCKRGDSCSFAHGVFECWLHPCRYRTQLCKEGGACRRSVCFFAHSVEQLREPTMLMKPDHEPSSPRGTLLGAEESEDTARSWSPVPTGSEDSVKLLASSTESLPRRDPLSLGTALSADSSFSSTPVVEGGLGCADSALQRTMSSLALASDDLSHVVALHQVASGMAPHPALLAASAAAAAANWPLGMPAGVAGQDALSALLGSTTNASLASGLQSVHGMHSVLYPDAVMQAAAAQHQLAVLQAQANGAGSLLAAAAGGARQPLVPLSLNLGNPAFLHRPAPPATAPTCLALGL